MPSFRDEQRLIHVAESNVYSTAALKPTAFHKVSPIGRSVSYSSVIRGFGSVLAEDNVDGAISWTSARRKNWVRGPRVRIPDAWKPVSSLIADIGNRIDSLPARNDILNRAGSFDFPPLRSISFTRPFIRRSCGEPCGYEIEIGRKTGFYATTRRQFPPAKNYLTIDISYRMVER